MFSQSTNLLCISLCRLYPDCDSHSPALLNLFHSFRPSICSTVAFPHFGNFNHVASVYIAFPSNSKEDTHFHCKVYNYTCADWGSLQDHLRDVPWEEIFKLGTSFAAAEFFSGVHVDIDVFIPHSKYVMYQSSL